MGDRRSRKLVKGLWTCVLISQLVFPSSLIHSTFLNPSIAYGHEEGTQTTSEGVRSLPDLLKSLDLDEYIRSMRHLSREDFEEIFSDSNLEPELVDLLYKGISFGGEVYGLLAERLEEEATSEKPKTDEKFRADIAKFRVHGKVNGDSPYLKNLEEAINGLEESEFSEEENIDDDQSAADKIELTQIDGKVAVRLIINNTNIVFLSSDMNTDHFERFMAKLALKRNTIVYQIDFKNGITDSRFQETHKNFSEWLRLYKRAVYVRPDGGQVLLGLLTGLIQAGVTETAGQFFASTAGLEATSAIHLMAAWSVFWGTFMGTYGRTMKEWHLVQGGPVTKTLKRSSISWTARYAYEISRMTLGIDAEVGEGLFDGEGSVQLHIDVALNVFLSNLARSGYYVAPRLHEILSEMAHRNVRVPLWGRELGFTYHDALFQVIYLMPFTISKMDQIFKNNMIMVFGVPVSFGKTIIYSGTVLSLASSVVFLKSAEHVMARRVLKNNDPDDKAKLTELRAYIAEIKKGLIDLVTTKPKKLVTEKIPELIKTIPEFTKSTAKGCHQKFLMLARSGIVL